MGNRSEIYKLVYAEVIEGYPISTFFCTFWTALTQQHYNLQHSQGYFHCLRVLNLQSWSFLLFCFSKQPQKLMLKFDIERLQRMPPLVTSNFLRVHQKNRSSSAARLVLLLNGEKTKNKVVINRREHTLSIFVFQNVKHVGLALQLTGETVWQYRLFNPVFQASSLIWCFINEACHGIMVLFVLRTCILQTRMRSHPVGLDV